MLDDVDVNDYFSDEDKKDYEVNRDELKPNSNCLENLLPNNNALKLLSRQKSAEAIVYFETDPSVGGPELNISLNSVPDDHKIVLTENSDDEKYECKSV